MKKNIISLVLVAMMISIIIAIVFWLKPNVVTMVPNPEVISTSNYARSIQLNAEQQEHALKIKEQVLKRHPNLKLDEEGMMQAAFKQHLFNEVPLDTIRSRLPIEFSEEALNDGRLFSEYNPLVIETKRVGDQIQWQALEYGLNQIGVIEEIEHLEGDVYRWSGSFEGKDPVYNNFRITQSLSENYAIAKINTHQGSFEFETKNGIGWIRPGTVRDTDLHAQDDHIY